MWVAELVIGLAVFREYGLSWDEPLFYEYGEALGYAYQPAHWFRPDFDLTQAYGPSPDDHKNRGPAYLVLMRLPVRWLTALGLERAAAWHLVNFLTFLLGVAWVYRLSLRWMSEPAALGAAMLFSTQPLLWGHAFINPKDMPFLVFFLGALVFGFELVDRQIAASPSVGVGRVRSIWFPAFLLGSATAMRILAPLAGLLVILYAAVRYAQARCASTSPKPSLAWLSVSLLTYWLLAALFTLILWPYLWEAPIRHFVQVFLFMAENPTGLQVLFDGQAYRAFDLPRRYLPTLLALTLTEPIWPLFGLGLVTALWRGFWSWRRSRPAEGHAPARPALSADYWLALTAFFLPFFYVLLVRPPMYDGFRHFLFILPPAFVTCGLGIETLLRALRQALPNVLGHLVGVGLILLLALPGIWATTRLHPYSYSYYNAWIGGTGGAFRRFETEYWLTCYKEAVEQINTAYPQARLFVHREAYIAAAYAAPGLTVLEARGNRSQIRSGDLILVNSRLNEDRKTFRDAPILFTIGRENAVFCVVKQVP